MYIRVIWTIVLFFVIQAVILATVAADDLSLMRKEWGEGHVSVPTLVNMAWYLGLLLIAGLSSVAIPLASLSH